MHPKLDLFLNYLKRYQTFYENISRKSYKLKLSTLGAFYVHFKHSHQNFNPYN